MAIILQDYNLWNDLGKAVGMLGGNRLAELEKIDDAKKIANVLYGQQQQPQAQVAPDTPQQVQIPRSFSQAMQTALSAQTPIDLWKQTQGMQTAQPQIQAVQPPMQAQIQSLINYPQKSFFDEAVPVKENALPELPNKDSMQKEMRQSLGKEFVDLVKGGMSINEAKQLLDSKLEKETATRYNEWVRKYQNDVLEPMRQQIMNNLVYAQDKDGNYIVDSYNSSKVKGLFPSVARYNQLASKVGLQTIDMNNLNSIASINKPDFKYQSVGNGDLLRFNGENGDIQNVGNFSPTKVQKFDDGRYVGVDGRGQVKQDYGVHNAPQAPNRAGTGTSGYNAQIVRSLTTNHINWVKNHPDQDESQSPYYDRLTEAIGVTVGASGGGTITPYSSEEQTMVANRMNELKAQGYTDDQIASELDSAGLGQYKSWLETY